MTPTSVCHMMNKAYEKLKELSISQLEDFKDRVLVSDAHPLEKILMEYQADETIRRKKLGIW